MLLLSWCCESDVDRVVVVVLLRCCVVGVGLLLFFCYIVVDAWLLCILGLL